MENIVSFLVVAGIVAVFLYFKNEKFKEFVNSKLGIKRKTPQETSIKPSELVFSPVNTPVATKPVESIVEPVRTPEAIVSELVSPSKPARKEPTPVSEPVNQVWPPLPPVFSADNTGHTYPMYYDVALPATSNLVVDSWFKGTFQILGTVNQQKQNTSFSYGLVIRDLHKEGAPVVAGAQVPSSQNLTVNIKPLASKPTSGRLSAQDFYLPEGSYKLEFTTTATPANILVTVAEFTV